MAEEVVTPAVTPAPDAAAAATPAPEVKPAAPAPAAAAKPAGDKIAEFVAKKTSLLGEDPDAKPAEGDKPVEGAATKPGEVPEKYTIKPPEGMTVDAALLDAVTPLLKAKGFTQEEAQKLADAYAPVVQKATQAQHEAAMKSFDDQVEAWGKETRAMLGPEFAKEKAPAVKFINTFGGKDAPAIRQLLTDTGLGNHPLIVKLLIAGGKAISQDSFVDGGNKATDESPEAVQSRMYPTMKKK